MAVFFPFFREVSFINLGCFMGLSYVNLCFKCEFSTLVLSMPVFLHISSACFNGVLNSSLCKQKQGFSSSCLCVSAEKGVKIISRAMLDCKDVIKKISKAGNEILVLWNTVSISYWQWSLHIVVFSFSQASTVSFVHSSKSETLELL